MKKLLIVLGVLLVVFIILWIVKLRAPLTPADPYQSGISEDQPWWENSPGTAPTPDEDWVLDPEIPENYIPVIGRDELYMVIDENGYILKYRQRTKGSDGSWIWEDINPDIPQNYSPVDGLENVYMTTDVDGTVHYYRYTRNPDDTFFFTEVDASGNKLVDDTPSGSSIPKNYVRIEGTNIYAVYNQYGVLLGYKERVVFDDGAFMWRDVDASAIDAALNSGSFTGGGIPGMNNNKTDITIITNDPEDIRKGYTEVKTTTETKDAGEWYIVYETTVYWEYDDQGNLLSTKKEGPTEVNRFPKTDVNSSILDEILGGN